MDFLWHKVSKEEQESIKKEAKQIIDNFAKSLKGIEKTEFKGVERNKQLRDETKTECDKEFRKLFFQNVPEKEGDWLKAEKGKWK
ncbi:hypothetical protein ACFLZZ_02385 [Nanoarchaeota archaeon]